MGWMFAGAWPTVVVLALLSVLVGLSEAVAAWLIGWIVDEAAAGPAAFFAANGPLLALAVGFFLLARPGLMILSSALTTRSLGPGLFHLGVWRLHRHTPANFSALPSRTAISRLLSFW